MPSWAYEPACLAACEPMTMNTVRNPEKGQQRDNCMLGRDENGRERAGKSLNHFHFRILLRKTGTGVE